MYTQCTYDQEATLATNSVDTQYTGRSYTITFDNGHSSLSNLSTASSLSGMPSNVSGNLVFWRWYLSGCDDTSKNGYYNEGAKVKNLTATDNGSITATAQWKSNDVYKSAGTNNTNVNNLTTNLYYSGATNYVNKLTMNGYTFKGWLADSTPSSVTYDKSGSYVKSMTIAPATTSADVKLKASWVANTYSVTFKFNISSKATHGFGGKKVDGTTLSLTNAQSQGYTESKNVVFDSAYGTLPIPTLKGWAFNGWFLDNELGKTSISFNGNAVTSSSLVRTYANHELVGHWTPNTYNIIFDRNTANSGSGLASGSMSNVTVTYDEDYTLPANGFNKQYTVTFNATSGTSESTKIVEYGTNNQLNTSGNTCTVKDIWEFDEWVWNKTAYDADSTSKPQSALSESHNYKNTHVTVKSQESKQNYINETNSSYRYAIENKATIKNLSSSNGATITLYATWKDDGIVLPDVKKEHNKFIGWYTVPQDSHGDTAIDREKNFVGQAGAIVSVDSDTTLYAWFNQNPTYTDIYEGTFYEGQDVSYVDLLKLIGVSDYEDDYRESVNNAITSLLQSNPDNEEKNGGDDNIEIDESELPPISDADDSGDDDSLRAQINAAINPSKLDVKVTKVVYTQELTTENADGTTTTKTWSTEVHDNSSIGGTASDKWYSVSGEDIKNGNTGLGIPAGLDTRTENIGYFTVYYEVTDNGIWNGAEQILEDNGYEIDSPITIEYSRKCQILYNNPPKMQIDKSVFVFTDNNYTSGTEAKTALLNYIHESDIQDNVNNAPWWSKTTASEALNASRDILAIKDVSVNDGWAIDNKDKANAIAKITSLDDLYNQNDIVVDGITITKDDKKNVTGFKLILDAVDQFGKHSANLVEASASNKGVHVSNPDGILPDGTLPETDYQDEPDRTLQIVLVNPDSDSGMIDANTYKNIRYISEKYFGTISNTYWSEYGKEILSGSFKEEALKNENPDVQSGSFTSENHGNTVDLEINDYTTSPTE